MPKATKTRFTAAEREKATRLDRLLRELRG